MRVKPSPHHSRAYKSVRGPPERPVVPSPLPPGPPNTTSSGAPIPGPSRAQLEELNNEFKERQCADFEVRREKAGDVRLMTALRHEILRLQDEHDELIKRGAGGEEVRRRAERTRPSPGRREPRLLPPREPAAPTDGRRAPRATDRWDRRWARRSRRRNPPPAAPARLPRRRRRGPPMGAARGSRAAAVARRRARASPLPNKPPPRALRPRARRGRRRRRRGARAYVGGRRRRRPPPVRRPAPGASSQRRVYARRAAPAAAPRPPPSRARGIANGGYDAYLFHGRRGASDPAAERRAARGARPRRVDARRGRAGTAARRRTRTRAP